MSDLYSELLVKKEPTAKDSIVKYGMIVLTVLAVAQAFLSADPSSRCSCVRCCIVFCDSADRSGV